jgi:hypothetical protein
MYNYNRRKYAWAGVQGIHKVTLELYDWHLLNETLFCTGDWRLTSLKLALESDLHSP